VRKGWAERSSRNPLTWEVSAAVLRNLYLPQAAEAALWKVGRRTGFATRRARAHFGPWQGFRSRVHTVDWRAWRWAERASSGRFLPRPAVSQRTGGGGGDKLEVLALAQPGVGRAGLHGISPMVWRRLLVPSTYTLRELHGVLQVAMGWEAFTSTSSACAPGAWARGSSPRPRPT
jgi:Plasmid pRiA4b ORF-3-like protein